MAFKQKKRVRNVQNRYMKPGALSQLSYSRTAKRSCTDIGKKRVVLNSDKGEMDLLHKAQVSVLSTTVFASPIKIDFHSAVEGNKQQRQPEAPKTPHAFEHDSESRLESLPADVLVKLLCHLHHDQLRAVFHVSQRIRTAVILARQFHFNYTTPGRSIQEMLMTKIPLSTAHWPSVSKGDGKGIWWSSPRTPKAPRHRPRPSRLHSMGMTQIAAVLFPETTLPSRCMVPVGLTRPVFKSVAFPRVLF